MRRVLLLGALLAPLGCATDEPTPPAPALDPRSQYDLAEELARADALDVDARQPELDRLRRAWEGRRYRWEVFLVPVLCARQDDCHVVPFDRARAGARIVQGWLPRLDLDETQLARLKDGCAARERCAVEIEGTLRRFVLSMDDPTSLRFDDVVVTRISGARR
jgi:hypothetical protein